MKHSEKIYPTRKDGEVCVVAQKLQIIMEVIADFRKEKYTQKQFLNDLNVFGEVTTTSTLQKLLAGPGEAGGSKTPKRLTYLKDEMVEKIVRALSKQYRFFNALSVEDFYEDVSFDAFGAKFRTTGISSFFSLPYVDINLEGRGEDKKALVHKLQNSTERWLNIQGRPGTGKTALLSQVIKEVVGKRKWFEDYLFITAEKWVKVNEDIVEINRSFHVENVIDLILGKFSLDFSKLTGSAEGRRVAALKILNETRVLLVIDEVDCASESDLQMFFQDLSDRSRTKVLSTSSKEIVSDTYFLSCLEKDKINKVAQGTLKRLNVTLEKEEIDELVDFSQGSLMAVNWIIKRLQIEKLSLKALVYKLRDNADFWGNKDLRKYLYAYANNSLTEEYRWLLCFVLAAKKPITVQQLKVVIGKNENEIKVIVEILLGLSLIEKRGEAYQVPLLAEYFLLKEVAPILRKFSFYAVAEMLCQIAVSAKEPTAPVWTEKIQVWRDLYPSFCREGRKSLGMV